MEKKRKSLAESAEPDARLGDSTAKKKGKVVQRQCTEEILMTTMTMRREPTIAITDAVTGQEKFRPQFPQTHPTVIFNRLCTRAIVYVRDRMFFYDLATNTELFTLKSREEIGSFNHALVDFSNDGTRALFSPSCTVRDADSGDIIVQIKTVNGRNVNYAKQAMFSGDDTMIIFSFLECIDIVDSTTGDHLNRFEFGLMHVRLRMVSLPGGPRCVGVDCTKLKVWNCRDIESVESVDAKHGSFMTNVCSCGGQEDNLVCVAYDAGITLWNVATKSIVWKKPAFDGIVQYLQYSYANQGIVVVTVAKNKIRVLDVSNGNQMLNKDLDEGLVVLSVGCPRVDSIVLL